jgi:hypothetical protein
MKRLVRNITNRHSKISKLHALMNRGNPKSQIQNPKSIALKPQLTVPILDFGFWILDYFSVQAPPLVGRTPLKSTL